MVKYGKQYREFQVQEWVKHYIDYKVLKQKIKYLKTKLPRREVPNPLINISNLSSMALEPGNNITEDQYLSPLYKLENGNYLKEFIDLLNEQFHKFYVFFSNTEKQLYKQINMHLYAKENYKNLSRKKIKSEINSLGICIYLAKCLNNFVNDNLTALKKILKKFDKNFKNYFGLITPKYILSQISSSVNDLDYIIQFKIIDEASCICEENAKILKKYYFEIDDNDNIILDENKNNENKENNDNEKNLIDNNTEEIKVDFMQLYTEVMMCIKEIDEVIDFKTQYKEWISFVKKGNKLVKNNPSLLENDIFNPILSSTNYRDSLIEKFLSTEEAFEQVEEAQNQITISDKNKKNMNLILLHRIFNNTLASMIYPNIFFFYKNENLNFAHLIIILFVSEISTFSSLAFFQIPNTKYVLLISYFIYFFGSLIHILSCDSFFNEFYNNYRFAILIVSRIFIGGGSMETVLRTYLVLYSPKYYLIKISKIYSYINFFGYVLGFLISCFLLLIPDFGSQVEILVYNKKNCIGWYGMIMSFILFFVNLILFTKENSNHFQMIKDQHNIQISINEEEEIESKNSKKIRKNYKKAKIEDLEKAIEKSDIVEGLIPEDNDEKDEINNSSKKPENINIINNDNPKEEKTDKEEIIPVNTKEIDDKKENNENNEIINEEPKIDKKINTSEDEKSENDANRKESNLSILSNNIDTGVNSSQVLSMKQKKLINKIESKLDEFNEKSNFTNINLIPNNIDNLIMKERNTFGYLKINLLIIFILLFFSNLIKENMFVLYLYILYEYTKIDIEYACLILSGIFLGQIVSLFFILPLKKINIFIKRYLIVFMVVSFIFMAPLLYVRILKESIYVLSLSVLGVASFSNIITVLASCYLSYLFPPRWNYFLGRMPIYTISAGKAIGILICLFISSSADISFYIIFAICVLFYGGIIVFLMLYKDFRIKIIARIIRKKAFEDKGI